MADPVIKFNNVVTGRKAVNASYQTKRYPEGVILYTTSAELPDTLSANALIFTTDTAELYVGTGTGIKKLKLGSEADLDPAIYLKIASARANYQSKIAAEESANSIKTSIAELKESVYSKADIDKFITEDINLDGVIDKMNTYTVERINALLEERAATTDVYTRDQADAIFDTKAELDEFDKLSDKHEALEETVSNLSDIVDTKAVADDVYTKSEVDDSVNTINDSIADLQADITDLQNTSAVKEEVDSSIEAINQDIFDLKKDKADQDDVEEKDAKLAADILEVSRDLEDLNADVYKKDTVDEKIQDLQSQISDCETTISDTASDIRKEIAEVNNVVTANKTAVNNNAQDILDNKSAIQSAQSDIQDLSEELATKAAADDVYTKAEIAELLEGKANLEEVYKKVDTYTAEKIQELFTQEDESDLALFYQKTEADDLFATKTTVQEISESLTDTYNTLSNVVDSSIPSITEKVDAAVETSNEALISANDSAVTATNANNTAIEAKATADAAKTTAAEAKTAATSVASLAETANTNSETALETARSAEDTVNEAVRAADRLTTRVASVELSVAAVKNNSVDQATLVTELNKKADVSLLDFKASKVELEQGLSFKANQSDLEDLQESVSENLATKESVNNKADIIYVDSQINSIKDITDALEKELDDIKDQLADTTDLDAKLDTKADISKVYTKEEVDELINDAVTQVLNELAFKLLGRE